MLWLRRNDVGAVILTNADYGTACAIRSAGRVLELLFDGSPLAEENVAVQSRRLSKASKLRAPH